MNFESRAQSGFWSPTVPAQLSGHVCEKHSCRGHLGVPVLKLIVSFRVDIGAAVPAFPHILFVGRSAPYVDTAQIRLQLLGYSNDGKVCQHQGPI